MSRSLANQRLRLSRPIMAWHRASFRNIPAGMLGRKGRGGGGYDGRVGNSRRTPDACGTRRRRMDRYEDLERSLDPHRAEEQEAAVAEVAGRLRQRGIAVTGAEDSDDLANLLAAVERFELAVEAHGGDLMVDDWRELRKSSTIRSPPCASSSRSKRTAGT